MSGSIPGALGNLEKLESLRLSNNQLSGSIPAELGNLDSVTTLYLHSNELSGPIPGELGNLDTLWVRYNQLSGPIPSELGNLVNLTSLYLKDNSLSGCVPDGLRGVDDSDMYLAVLQFCSDMPPLPSLPNPLAVAADRAALVALYNSTDGANWTQNDNWLSAEPIGAWHGVTTDEDGRVGELNLWFNGLNGTIPDLSALTKLWTLSLSSNQLSGPLLDLSALNNLGQLLLHNNSLSGPIEGLHHLTNVTSLRLAGNQLCLPADFDRTALRNGTVLAALDSLDLPTCTDEQSSVAPAVPQNLTTTVADSQVTLA